ncbi:ABC transporter permease [Phyllobacterium sp. SB3]|uniref:ABC transporter permease n=1 Tax=Phyllobacterium sp. SB3 TaxID=3156073 RepID=UPI0032AF1E27
MKGNLSKKILAGYSWLTVVFLVLPQAIVFLVSFNPSSRLVIPTSEWTLKWYAALAENEEFTTSFLISFLMAPFVAVCAVILGGVAAYAVVRFVSRPGLIEALFIAPILLPVTALSVAMFLFFHTLGMTNTIAAVVISHVVIAVPYAFRTLGSSIRGVNTYLEEAAMSLGASRVTAVRRITLPMIRPGIAAAALFCLIVSLDEITVTLFVGGRQIKTVPIQIFDQTEYGLSPMVAAASSILIVVSTLVILFLIKTIGLDNAYSLKR